MSGAQNIHRGKPILFLGAIMGGWAMARGGMVLLTPVPEMATVYADPVPKIASEHAPKVEAAQSGSLASRGSKLPIYAPPPHMTGSSLPTQPQTPTPIILTKLRSIQSSAPKAPVEDVQPLLSLPPPSVMPPLGMPLPASPIGKPSIPPQRPATQSWAASGWLLWRPGSGDMVSATGVSLPLYGGSQAGARLSYRVSDRHGLETYARASAPLATNRGKEIAIGAAVQPLAAINARIAVEQRVRLDATAKRSATAIMAYGGFGPDPIGPVELEGYGQAGVVGVKHPVGFADGSLAFRKEVARFGTVKAHVGAGLWGGIQPGAGRLDVGPRISLDLPVEGQASLRVALDWRQRVAGSAAPQSGPALTVGTDF